MPFIYNDVALNSLEKTIATERLANYMVMASGNRVTAFRLYERNRAASEAFYGVLQALEVAVRNTIHHVLSTDLGRADWYDSALLQAPETNTVLDAKTTILRADKLVIPGRIVAELTFGFWIRLMSYKYEKTLWVPHIYKAFPCLKRPDRETVFSRFDKIRNLRNRVAHHERIINRDLTRDYRDIIECIDWICPVTATWVNSRNPFQWARR